MTRDTFGANGGRFDKRGGGFRAHRRCGRVASRARATCALLCCALALQPSPLPGRAAPRSPRASGRPQSSSEDFTARSLLAVITSIASFIRPPAAAPEAVGIPPASLAAAYEPEPDAALVFLGAPAGLSVDSTTNSTTHLSWPPVSGAAGYRVERSPNLLTPYTPVGDTASDSFQDSGLTRGSTYLYRIRAVDADGALSPPSAVAMATAIAFVDPELIGANDSQGRPATAVKAVHLNDLRLAVAGVRRAAALPAPAWAEAVSSGTPVRAAHVQELRNKLDEALTALGLPTAPYVDPTLHTGENGSTPTPIRKIHFEQLRARATSGSGVTGSGLTAYDFASARLDQSNRTGGDGVDPFSRNFSWSLPLVSLPGRAGLDLGLSLTYNSLVWTKSGSYILFDGDGGWPAPGFRLGFPVVQGKFLDTQAQKYAYMLITPSGSRVSLRQTAAAGVYEAGDSSYLQMTEEADGSLTLRPPEGSRLSYRPLGGVYKCTEIKDRNGNFITVSYNAYDDVESVTDTLGRVVSFGYDSGGYLKEITQTWHREVESSSTTQVVTETHQWARFYYEDKAVNTNFPGLTVFGPQNGQSIHALTKVKLADDSSYTFNYTSWGQAYQFAGYAADGRLLNYVSLNLPADAAQPQSDCPRPTESREWAAYWNGDSDGAGSSAEEAVTGYEVTDGVEWTNPETNLRESGRRGKVTSPDGTIYKEFAHTSGWDAGLARLSEVWSGGVRMKWTSIAFTQDDESLGYRQNPRVEETNVYDADDDGALRDRRRTEMVYTSFGLPQDVKEYDSDASTVLRRTHTEYVPESVSANGPYAARRIIGLAQKREVYGTDGGQEKLFSKVTFDYDLVNAGGVVYLADAGTVAQHDGAYGASSTTRGNVCRTRRWDAAYPSDQLKSVASEAGYNTLGSVLFTSDALGHKTAVSYADSDGGARQAYPTKVTDADGFYSTVKYNYDTGAVTRTVDPRDAAVKTFYDAAGRVLKTKLEANGAYTGWEYGASGLYAKRLTKVDSDKAETFVMNVMDGAGRVRGSLRETPGGEGGYAAQRFNYDLMGRQSGQSNPVQASVNADNLADVASWQPAGEDATSSGGTGWVYTTQSYDWKGRPLVTTNTDGSTVERSYGGCGCAGNEVVTIKGEMVPTNEPSPSPSQARRVQKVYQDALGRAVKMELYKWDGVSVYSSTTTKYDALDRAVRVRRYAGAAPFPEPEGEGEDYQTTTLAYDGHGRLKERHDPIQDAGRNTTYAYNADDTVQSVTDARGVKTVFGYNARRLVESVSYDLTNVIAGQDVQATTSVTFTYDAAGNRASMSDGAGSTAYHYDALSRMDWEERHFDGLAGAYRLSYEYNLAGELKSVADSWATVSYAYDGAGRMTGVTGSGVWSASQYARDIKYRAWGALSEMTYGNNDLVTEGYDARLRPASHAVESRPAQSAPSAAMSSHYTYYADGRVKFSDDHLDDRFDRAYYYDQSGRLEEAYTGAQARDFINGVTNPTSGGPYRQSYHYDEYDRLTGRESRYWGRRDDFSATYEASSGRNQSWQYDAEGDVTQDETLTYKYEAAGGVREVRALDGSKSATQWVDGGGLIVKREEREPATAAPSTTYYLRSSVMGGAVVAELNPSGQRAKGYVHAGGSVLAEQVAGVVTWRHEDPVTGSLGRSYADGTYEATAEMDSGGVNVGVGDPTGVGGGRPYVPDMEMPTFDSGAADHLCILDGLTTDCATVQTLMEIGVLGVEYLIQDGGGLRRVTQDIEPLGLGLYGTEEPYLRPDNEWKPGDPPYVVDWRSVAFSFAPQNPVHTPTPDAGAIGDILKEMLSNPNCSNFVSALYKEVAANNPGNPANSESILELFGKVTGQDQGGLVRRHPLIISGKPANGTVSGSLESNNATVIIGGVVIHGGSPNPTAAEISRRISLYDATVTLHELFHLGGQNNGYSDEQLAKAAFAITGAPGLPAEGSDPFAWSAYWNNQLLDKKHCSPLSK